jgi:hypothetical protein
LRHKDATIFEQVFVDALAQIRELDAKIACCAMDI